MTAVTIPAGITPEPGVPCVIAVAKGEWKRPEGLREAPLPVRVPPADWVEKEAAKCETCDGWESGPDVHLRCPDCHDGRLLHEVRVACYCKPIRDAGRSWPYGDCLVPVPCTGGYYTVHALLDVVPVVEMKADAFDCPLPGEPHVCMLQNRVGGVIGHHVIYTPDNEAEFIVNVEALGRIEPGMFALVVTVVER